MTPTQEDHEAAARLMEEMGFRVVEVHQKLPAVDIPVCEHTRYLIESLIAAALSGAVRVAVEGEREVAAKALCDLCHDGKYPVRPGKYRPNEWWHDVGDAQLPCKAAAIRSAPSPVHVYANGARLEPCPASAPSPVSAPPQNVPVADRAIHRHRCACGAAWDHASIPHEDWTPTRQVEAHGCPACGVQVVEHARDCPCLRCEVDAASPVEPGSDPQSANGETHTYDCQRSGLVGICICPPPGSDPQEPETR